LTWSGESGYESNGVDPDLDESGSAFTFRVMYSDSFGEAPSVAAVWVDLDDNLNFEASEKITMSAALGAPNDGDYTNGEIYTLSMNIPYPAGSLNGKILYRFYFEDSSGAEATGDPTSPLTLTVGEALSSCDLAVCDSCTYTTIQAAVTSSVDDDIVCVDDGTYAPFAFNGKDIIVRSINGPATTIIDGGGSGTIVDFNDYSSSLSDSTLKGFTVTNGTRGIFVLRSQATIVDCIIENHTSFGIEQNTNASDGPLRPLVIDETVIRNNIGPAIKTNNGAVVANITDTLITGNIAASGAGLSIGGGTITLQRCELSNNEASAGDGGAISFTGTPFNLTLIDSDVTENSASGNGGGLNMMGNDAGVIVIEATSFAGNQAVHGGGMYIGDGDYTITNSIFSGNYAAGNGGGVSAFDNAQPIFMNCTFAGNSAELGGGIHSTMAQTAYLKVHNSILWGNESRASVDEQIDGPVIDDPGSIYRAEVQYTDIGIDQIYSVFSNEIGNMYVDPLFFNPVPASSAPTASGDYHLLAASPVIDQALAPSPPADDIDGEVRPNPDSAGYDMGADEYYISLGPDVTTVGTATAIAVDETTINITMMYGKDYNGDNTYAVEYKLSSSGTWLDWGTNPKAHTASPYTDTITGLTPGASYDVRMTYIDPDGVSGTNPRIISVVLQDNATTVGTATAVMASVTNITVNLPYISDDDGDNTYTVQYKLSSSGSWLDWGSNPKAHAASPYSDSITGLTAGETYDVQMTYNDADGVNGTNPQTVNTILLVNNSTTVGSATAIKASETSIAVTMPYGDDNNGNNTYSVEYSANGGGSWTPWVTAAAHTVSPYTDTITGLPAGTYDVRMTYNDAEGVTGINPQAAAGIALSPITGTVLRVCSGETYTTIQAAINAVSEDGTTVLVCEGTYSENITLNGIWETTVKAEGLAANTTIQGSGSNVAVVTFDNPALDSNTVLEGFTLDNQASGSATRGVYISNGASPVIQDCIIENNQADNQNGAGIYITGSGGADISNSIIRGNTTGVNQGYGGGIYYDATGSLTISDSNIDSNHAQRNGGGLYINSATAVITMTRTTVSSNDAGGNEGGGGLYMLGTSPDLTLLQCYVQGNSITSFNNNAEGAGIRIDSGTATIINSIIAGNIANGYQADGGGIYNSGTLNLYFSTITDNFVQSSSGGLHANGIETVRNSIIWGSAGGSQIGGTVETLYLTETTNNPSFTSSSQASSGNPTTDGDYHLQVGSNCINTGDATNGPADDIEGTLRPVDQYDKGAYEYVP
ncbi:MAG: hypothetical protein GY732_10315, partial [Gammaproteobacteria bacterium]|nr:hypothetical protein [Gammaproteobacteria bacterium]